MRNACNVCRTVTDDQTDFNGDGFGDVCDVCPDVADDGATECDSGNDSGGCSSTQTGSALWLGLPLPGLLVLRRRR